VISTASLPLLYAGKVRRLYALDNPNQVLIVATDAISAYDQILATPIPDKGAILTQLSVWWSEQLKDIVPNHVISTAVPSDVQGRAVICERLEMIPVECVARGYITGSGWAEYQVNGTIAGLPLPPDLQHADRLPQPIFTPATKAPQGEHDENISYDQLVELVGPDLAARLRDLTLALFARGSRIAAERGIILADTKFEFGRRADGTVVLADEVLTPDSSRFWDAAQYHPGAQIPSFDKQYVRDWLAYDSGWDKNSDEPAPALPRVVVQATRDRYLEAYARLTGHQFVPPRSPSPSLLLPAGSTAATVPTTTYIVDVMPKPEILDPQGKAVTGALARLGYEGFAVRQGKRFEIQTTRPDDGSTIGQICSFAEALLANPVIESFALSRQRPGEGPEPIDWEPARTPGPVAPARPPAALTASSAEPDADAATDASADAAPNAPEGDSAPPASTSQGTASPTYDAPNESHFPAYSQPLDHTSITIPTARVEPPVVTGPDPAAPFPDPYGTPATVRIDPAPSASAPGGASGPGVSGSYVPGAGVPPAGQYGPGAGVPSSGQYVPGAGVPSAGQYVPGAGVPSAGQYGPGDVAPPCGHPAPAVADPPSAQAPTWSAQPQPTQSQPTQSQPAQPQPAQSQPTQSQPARDSFAARLSQGAVAPPVTAMPPAVPAAAVVVSTHPPIPPVTAAVSDAAFSSLSDDLAQALEALRATTEALVAMSSNPEAHHLGHTATPRPEPQHPGAYAPSSYAGPGPIAPDVGRPGEQPTARPYIDQAPAYHQPAPADYAASSAPNSYADARPSEYGDVRPPTTYSDGRPPTGFADGRPPTGFADGRPTAAFADGRQPTGFADGRPPAAYEGSPEPRPYAASDQFGEQAGPVQPPAYQGRPARPSQSQPYPGRPTEYVAPSQSRPYPGQPSDHPQATQSRPYPGQPSDHPHATHPRPYTAQPHDPSGQPRPYSGQPTDRPGPTPAQPSYPDHAVSGPARPYSGPAQPGGYTAEPPSQQVRGQNPPAHNDPQTRPHAPGQAPYDDPQSRPYSGPVQPVDHTDRGY
jgi:phosphoribosylaminoimidazole-succinocarboxamide synthase